MDAQPSLGPKHGREAAGVAVASVVALAFALSFGLNFGIGNQLMYLSSALRRVDPTLLRRDWFVTQTTQYHLVYTRLGAGLLGLDKSGWVMALVYLGLVTAVGVALYAACRVLAGQRGALPSFFLTMAFAFAGHWQGPLTTYVFDGTLQPSGLSSAFLLGGAAAFVTGRFGLSGFLLGVAAFCHLNLLVLILPVFGLAHLLLGREHLGRRLALGLAWVVLAALVFLPMFLRANTAVPDAALARHVLTLVRAPHHFDLRAHVRDFGPFCAWQLVAFAVLLPLVRTPGEQAFKRLAALIFALGVAIWAGTLGAFVTDRLALVFAWRLTAHFVLLCQLALCTVVVRALLEPELWARFPSALRAGSRLASFVRARPYALTAVCGVLLVNYALGPLARLRSHSNLLVTPPANARGELEAWMRERSPKDALFLIPPEEEDLRFRGERAVVVDWKNVPSIPGEVLEWYRRICDVAGRRVDVEADLAGYAALDAPRLAALRQRYGVDFAVVEREHAARLAGYASVYSNANYVVFDASPPGAKAHASR